MQAPRLRYLRSLLVVSLTVFAGSTRATEPCCPKTPRCLDDLKHYSLCELHDLFARSNPGELPCGDFPGRVLYLGDCRLPRLKAGAANLVWRGKAICSDSYAANRWIGNRRWLGTHYCSGTSWVDGRPAITLDYPSGTFLFGDTRDELREVAPGLYLGIMFTRHPCAAFRGFFAIQTSCSSGTP